MTLEEKADLLTGEAVSGILFGAVCPSGKLAETYPLNWTDSPCANYFPGNAYITFAYRNLTLGRERVHPGGTLTAALDVANTGRCAGAEIVQIYVQPPEGEVYHPVRALRAAAYGPADKGIVEGSPLHHSGDPCRFRGLRLRLCRIGAQIPDFALSVRFRRI